MIYLLIALAILSATNTGLMLHSRRLSAALHNANKNLADTQKRLRVWKRACARLTRMVASGMTEQRIGTVICNGKITHDRN